MQKNTSGTIALRNPYLRVLHLELSSPSANASGGSNPFGIQFTPEEEEEFGQMARSDGFYERFAKSIAPSIYGSHGIYSMQILPHVSLRYFFQTLKRPSPAYFSVVPRRYYQMECDCVATSMFCFWVIRERRSLSF